MQKEIKINTESIQLDQFLKWANIVSSGGEAKNIIQEGNVLVNQKVEYSRGRKLFPGDRVELLGGKTIYIVSRD
ncbi:MAG: S4 domain-containing protein YaaA [Bacillota bacterium]